MSNARSAILGRLRAAAPDARRPGLALPATTRHASRQASPVETLTAALDSLGVTWATADSPVSARLALVTALQAEKVSHVLTWRDDALPVPGIQETLNVLGIATTIPDLRAAAPRLRRQDPDTRRDLLRAVAAVEVGLIAAEAALASSGALIVRGGAGRPFLSAFLPRRLVVLLPASQIFPSVQDWRDAAPLPAEPLTFVAGPSQSLDLELIPALGIHGPRRVHAVVVNGT